MPKETSSKSVSLRSSPPRQMNVPEAAAYISISQRYLRNLIAERKIPCVRVGSRVIFRLCDIDRWLESKLEGSTRQC